MDAIETTRPARARSRKPRQITAEELEAITSEAAEQGVSLEERQRLIAEHAYYRAERRGFEPGQELDDWLEAEAELKGRFGWE